MDAKPATLPAHIRISTRLREMVAAGEFSNGRQLPTELELAKQYGVSRQTVRRAFHDLVGEGTVFRVPGRGTFADESRGKYLQHLGSIEDLLGLSADTTTEVISPLQRGVDVDAASRMRLDTDTLYSMQVRRFHENQAFAHAAVFLPEKVGRTLVGLPEVAEGATGAFTVIGLLEHRLDNPIVEASQSITVRPASETVARALGCEPGHPMLRVDRLFFDSNDEIAELTITHFLPELYTYRVMLKRTSGGQIRTA